MKTNKKILLICGLIVLSFSSIAQTQVITFAPQGLVNKFRMKYENVLNENMTVGVYFNAYFYSLNMYYKGMRVDPFIRLYPTGKAPKGIYIQAKAVIGYFNSDLAYDFSYDSQINGKDTTFTLTQMRNRNFSTFGGGMGIGYQLLVGRGQMPIDFFIGFQYSKFTAPQTIMYNNKTYTTSDDVVWYVFGPGSFLNCNIGIGFSF